MRSDIFYNTIRCFQKPIYSLDMNEIAKHNLREELGEQNNSEEKYAVKFV